MVGDRRLSAGHARALLATPDRSFQDALAERICREGLSVRQTEEAVRRRAELHAKLGGAEVPPASTPDAPGDDGAELEGDTDVETGARSSERALPPAGVLELEEVLGNYLDTKVQISLGRARGRIAIDFADLADLERIYRLMADPSA
jgi:ParB family chromosome partitioning protein